MMLSIESKKDWQLRGGWAADHAWNACEFLIFLQLRGAGQLDV